MMPEKTILVSGYFSSIAQPDKLEFFERLDATLQQQGYRIVLLSQTSEKLKTSCAYQRVPRFVLTAERLHLGGRAGHAGDAVSRQAASILSEKDSLPLPDCVAKVKLFQHFILRAMRKYKPAAFLAWHEFNPYHYSISALLKEHRVPSFFVEYGVLPGTLNFDAQGQMAKSWIAGLSHDSELLRIDDEDIRRASEFLAALREAQWLRRPGDPRKELSEKFEKKRKAGTPIVFCAGQNDFAAGILPAALPDAKIHSPHFEDTRDALAELVQLARAHDWLVVFKPHPLDTRDWASMAEAFGDVLSVEPHADIFACIECSDVTVTILSQVSYLALASGRPCVLLGRTQLSGKGCAYEIAARDDTADAIRSALNREGHDTRVRLWEKHVAQLMRHYLLPYTQDAQPYFKESAEEIAQMLIAYSKGKTAAKIDGGAAPEESAGREYADPAKSVAALYGLLHTVEPILWLAEKIRRVVGRAFPPAAR